MICLYISYKQTLSEEFIEKFQNRLDWVYLSLYQDLSEDFIIKFKHKVFWIFIGEKRIGLSPRLIEAKEKDQLVKQVINS